MSRVEHSGLRVLVGARVTELRREHDITQVALACRAGISVSLLSKMRPRPVTPAGLGPRATAR